MVHESRVIIIVGIADRAENTIKTIPQSIAQNHLSQIIDLSRTLGDEVEVF